MSRRRRLTRKSNLDYRKRVLTRSGKVAVGTAIALGLGAVVAGVAIYEFTKPKATTTTALPPSGPAQATVLGTAAS